MSRWLERGAALVAAVLIPLLLALLPLPSVLAVCDRWPRIGRGGATPNGLADRVRSLRPDGVEVVADFVGGNLEATLAVLADGGRHASIADSDVEEHGGTWMWVSPVGAQLQELADLVDDRKMRVEVAGVFPLDRAADAFRLNMAGHTRGKIVVTVDQTP